MSVEYYPVDDDLRAMANKLINNHFSHLGPKRVEFVFVVDRDAHGRELPPKSKGKDVWGRARVISGLGAYFAVPEEDRYHTPDKFFVIEIARPVWEKLENLRHKEALLHHELSHCDLSETGQPTIAPHTLEEFTPTVREYGAWRHDVEAFIRASVEQMPLFEVAGLQGNDDQLGDTINVEIDGQLQTVTREQVLGWLVKFDEQAKGMQSARQVVREFRRKHPDVTVTTDLAAVG